MQYRPQEEDIQPGTCHFRTDESEHPWDQSSMADHDPMVPWLARQMYTGVWVEYRFAQPHYSHVFLQHSQLHQL
jgi:hypothetical protein